jgi:transposase
VRASTLLRRLLDLPGITVRGFSMLDGRLDVDIALTRRRLLCPRCGYSSRSRYDTRPAPSSWRHLDFGACIVVVRAELRRLRCPQHGVVVEAVPFARHRAGFTRDFEAVTAFMATKTDKTTIARFLRIDWDTVGRICQRVVATDMDHDRLAGLVTIGVDEVSWRKHHHYLTLVTDHTTGTVVWGRAGRDTETLNAFFTELGDDEHGQPRAEHLQAVSMDMGHPFNASVNTNAPQATICIDPFHVVKLATEALDLERRKAWNELRHSGDPAAAKKFKGARWALLKNPDRLTDDQAATLRRLKRRGGDVWRAYTLKEALRAVFAGDLTTEEVTELLYRWISRATRSRLPAFVKAAATIRKFRHGILAAIHLRINNGRAEGLNNVVRLIIRRARGFHSPQAALALVMLTCGPITIHLPHERHTK